MNGRCKAAQVERLEVVDMGRRRRWSEDEKLKIVLESLHAPRQVAATARRYGVSRSLLLRWPRSFRPEPKDVTEQQMGFAPAMMVPESGTTHGPSDRPAAGRSRLSCGRGSDASPVRSMRRHSQRSWRWQVDDRDDSSPVRRAGVDCDRRRRYALRHELAGLVGGDKQMAAELAQMKGRMVAIEQASIQKKCGVQFQGPRPPGTRVRLLRTVSTERIGRRRLESQFCGVEFFDHPRPRNSSARRRGRQAHLRTVHRAGPARRKANGRKPARRARQERGGARSRPAETAKSGAAGRVIKSTKRSLGSFQIMGLGQNQSSPRPAPRAAARSRRPAC